MMMISCVRYKSLQEMKITTSVREVTLQSIV